MGDERHQVLDNVVLFYPLTRIFLFGGMAHACRLSKTKRCSQIHIRTPSDEEQQRPTAASAFSSPFFSDALTDNEQPRHTTALYSDNGLVASSLAASSGRGATLPPDPGTPSLSPHDQSQRGADCSRISGGSSTGSNAGEIGCNNEGAHDAELAHGVSGDDENESAAETSVGDKLSSESLPSEVFYSMKVVAGKDAVGTLSGPGTLGIEGLHANVGGAGEGTSAPSSAPSGNHGKHESNADVCLPVVEGGWSGSSGSGGRGNMCGEGSNRGNGGGEERRSAVRTLLDSFSWGGSGGGGGTDGQEVAGGENVRLLVAGSSGSGDGGEGGSGREPMGGLNGRGIEAQLASVDDRGALGGYGPTTQRAPQQLGDAGDAGVGLGGRSSGGFDGEHLATGMGAGYARGKGRSGNGGGGQDSLVFPDSVYLYSLEKGFLMLRPDLRQKHGIVTANVTISVHDPCLGGPVIQVLR